MQDRERLQEIEKMGEEEALEGEDWKREDRKPERKGGGIVPLAQAFLCAFLLAALLFLKAANQPAFEKFSQWYQREAAQEIQLPQWGREDNAVPSQPAESSGIAPPAVNLDGAMLQRV